MDLNTYLEQAGAGAAAVLAKRLGITPVLISQWRAQRRPVPAARCPEIERASGGKVRCEELRSDVDWDYLRAHREAGLV